MDKGRATRGWNFLPGCNYSSTLLVGALVKRDLDGLATWGIHRHFLKTNRAIA